jgi:hypothetical protein
MHVLPLYPLKRGTSWDACPTVMVLFGNDLIVWRQAGGYFFIDMFFEFQVRRDFFEAAKGVFRYQHLITVAGYFLKVKCEINDTADGCVFHPFF